MLYKKFVNVVFNKLVDLVTFLIGWEPLIKLHNSFSISYEFLSMLSSVGASLVSFLWGLRDLLTNPLSFFTFVILIPLELLISLLYVLLFPIMILY